MASPFDKLIEGLFQPKMVPEAVNVGQEISAQDAVVFPIINTWGGGNALMPARVVETHI